MFAVLFKSASGRHYKTALFLLVVRSSSFSLSLCGYHLASVAHVYMDVEEAGPACSGSMLTDVVMQEAVSKGILIASPTGSFSGPFGLQL
jgi:hypothetical protein